MPQNENFDGRKLRSALKKRCWTQAKLATESGVSERTISRAINEDDISPPKAKALADALEAPMTEFLLEEIETPTSRRRFLLALGSVAALTGAGVLGKFGGDAANGMTRSARWIYEETKEAAQRSLDRVSGEYLDGLFPSGSVWNIGSSHPNVPGTHPDNFSVANTLANGFSNNHVVDPTPFRPHGTVAVIGSPVSNQIARDTFGPVLPSDSPPPNPWNLPIVYTQGDGSNSQMAKRWVDGNKYQTVRGGYYHRDDRHPTLVELAPDSRQANDYLIITVLPNYLDPSSVVTERGRIWHIGGIHGPGTKAFIELFYNDELIGNLIERADRDDYFQALYRIETVEHDDKRRRVTPGRIVDLQYEALDRRSTRERAIMMTKELQLSTT